MEPNRNNHDVVGSIAIGRVLCQLARELGNRDASHELDQLDLVIVF